MGRIHFVGGEKGGVGKSVVARLLCQWLTDHGVSLGAFDGDLERGSLMRAHPGVCRALDVTRFESVDQVMELALDTEGDIVVDLPAKSHRSLLQWIEESSVSELAQARGIRLFFWLVSDGSYQSAQWLEGSLPELLPLAEVILVCNQRFSGDFLQLKAGAEVARISEYGGRILNLPVLDAVTMYQLDRHGASFGAALEESGAGILTPMQRRRLARWQSDANAQVELALQPRSQSELPVVDEVALPEPASALPEPASALPEPSNEQGVVIPEPEVVSLPAPTTDQALVPAVLSQPSLPVGSTWSTGPRTWAEVGEGYVTHYVRCS